jgi:hypothetical protein
VGEVGEVEGSMRGGGGRWGRWRGGGNVDLGSWREVCGGGGGGGG